MKTNTDNENATPASTRPDWTPADSRALYNVPHWGDGCFDINADGHVTAIPCRDGETTEIDFLSLTRELERRQLDLPVLVHFGDILRNRVTALCRAFDHAMDASGFDGGYTPVYPVKVNQQRRVVEELLHGGDGRAGLEAGSKPELMAVLALAPAGSMIVCNGYKDRAYVRLALLGRLLGHRVYIVAEKASEVALVLEQARDLHVEPLLGLRVRLAAVSAGKWQNTGGAKSKFGLSAGRVLDAVATLRAAGCLHSLRMLHVHLGSQVANVRDIQRGMREVARFYAELRARGAPVDCVDVGGGLGVDYEGSRSRSFCSMNYSAEEYALNVVRTLTEVCREQDLPCPHIVSESGRALTAHHSVLITRVVDVERVPEGEPMRPADDAPPLLRDLWQALDNPDRRPPRECWHDAARLLDDAHAAYAHGMLDLAQRAQAEQLHYAICRRVWAQLDPSAPAHREIRDRMREKLADKYFCNLSLFQSLPDVWAIDQIFPVMPIHRLGERPERRAVIGDLTCDSDGRIDHYADRHGVQTTLALHTPRDGEAYLLGFFLVGAYQEILGDMHNLFGDTHAVNVMLDGEGGWAVSDIRRGEGADDMLRAVHFDPDKLYQTYRDKLAASAVDPTRRAGILKELAAGLRGYTYLLE